MEQATAMMFSPVASFASSTSAGRATPPQFHFLFLLSPLRLDKGKHSAMRAYKAYSLYYNGFSPW
jgi:hypothetical protein